jgi:hypothetical protein
MAVCGRAAIVTDGGIADRQEAPPTARLLR